MKILQLIDSLQAGGAERMAVHIANSLNPLVEGSYLCVSRKEGPLKASLNKEVGYLFLNKQSTIDRKAFRLLRTFLQKEKITHIHAHGTSFFLATVMKWRLPHLKLVYHEHHGKRISGTSKDYKALTFCSRFFDSVITVNEALCVWCKNQLHCKEVYHIPNFIPETSFLKKTDQEKPFIVHLANLRPVKDQMTLLKAFSRIHDLYPEWNLRFVGKEEDLSYLETLKDFVNENDIKSKVHFMGVQQNIFPILQESSIGVLSSTSEGLPMALLEYGAAGLPVIATDVGYCREVVSNFGKIVPPNSPLMFAKALQEFMGSPEERKKASHDYTKHIFNTYSSKKIVTWQLPSSILQ